MFGNMIELQRFNVRHRFRSRSPGMSAIVARVPVRRWTNVAAAKPCVFLHPGGKSQRSCSGELGRPYDQFCPGLP